jgi:hypothetical protein
MTPLSLDKSGAPSADAEITPTIEIWYGASQPPMSLTPPNLAGRQRIFGLNLAPDYNTRV